MTRRIPTEIAIIQTGSGAVADAAALDEDGKIDTIVDWKSDVEVLLDRVAHYLEQLRTYRKQTGAELALLVFMTPSKVIHA
jgi:hypothetical protein